MTSDRPLASGGRRRLSALSPRRELVAVLLSGAAGAGLVFLAMRQGWAQVRTAVPAPLPSSVITDSGQSLVPYADALAIAALASLAAVLATRRTARRATGGLLAVLGIGIAAAVSFGVTAAAAVAAATGNIGPGSGAGTTAGSATEGGSQSGSIVPAVAGFHSHAVLTAAGWQAMAIVGALAIVVAGVLVIWRAERLPVMSSKYESPTGTGAADRNSTGRAGTRLASSAPNGAAPDSAHLGDAHSDGAYVNGAHPDNADLDAANPIGPAPSAVVPSDAAGDAASMWESLSRGEDPTSVGRIG
ncbi:MAG TPA: Trp biosynthesis-associated membrane protein [Streptosporangiaceae bacterium]|nr:Trp biosynthesis-associated membrane protein [Streptosporangiaceae bacterium]